AEDPTTLQEVGKVAAVLVDAEKRPPIIQLDPVRLIDDRIEDLVRLGVILDAAVERCLEAEFVPEIRADPSLREGQIELPVLIGSIDDARPGQDTFVD